MQTIYAKLDKGMDSFIRVSNTLRRKEYAISGMNLQASTSESGSHDIHIHLHGSNPMIANRAMRQIAKLIDVHSIQLIREA